MQTQTLLLLYLIEYLCITTIIICFIPRHYRAEISIFALTNTIIYFMLVIIMWSHFDKSFMGFQYMCSIPLIPEYKIYLSLGLDGISLCFLLLTAFIMPLCIFAAQNIHFKYKQFIIYLLLIEIFLSLSFLVTNLFFFYIFFESVLIPMFILIGVWGARKRKINAAYYFFLYTLSGSFFLLFGILYLYTIVESTDYSILSNIILTSREQIILWILFFIPFAVKIPMFPFHIWLPEAHVEAPTIGSVILASLLLKLGGYGFLRFTITMFPTGYNYFSGLISTLALFSIICASLATIRQNDLKRIIAYSSIAHMNLIVLGLFSGTHQGIDGAVFLMLGHGITSAALFFCIGIVYDRYHTRSLLLYSGLVQTMPLFTIFFFIFTIANISFPGTSNFPGELLIVTGLFEDNTFIMILAATGIILSAIYSIWQFNRVLFGTLKIETETTLNYADLNRAEFLVLLILTLAMIWLGMNADVVTSLTYLPIKKILLTTYFKR